MVYDEVFRDVRLRVQYRQDQRKKVLTSYHIRVRWGDEDNGTDEEDKDIDIGYESDIDNRDVDEADEEEDIEDYEGNDNSQHENMAEITSLRQVCQQLYAETRFFPLSKTIFYFENPSMRELLLAKLTDAQRIAITCVGLQEGLEWFLGATYRYIREKQGLGPQHDVTAVMPDYDRDRFLADYDLREFTGLRRVVVDEWRWPDNNGVSMDWVRSGVRFAAGKHELEVVFGR